TEQSRCCDVEEQVAKAGEDVGCAHGRGWLSGSWNRYQWTRLVRPNASPLACGATPPQGVVWSNDSSCARARNTALPLERSPPGSFKRWSAWARSAGHGSSPPTTRPFSTSVPEPGGLCTANTCSARPAQYPVPCRLVLDATRRRCTR